MWSERRVGWENAATRAKRERSWLNVKKTQLGINDDEYGKESSAEDVEWDQDKDKRRKQDKEDG